MVSWSDGSESSRGNLSNVNTDSMNTMYDSDYYGLAEGNSPPRCKHGVVFVRAVAFEGSDTGRRFYRCAGQDGVHECDFVQWVDRVWPSSLGKALVNLLEKYDEVKTGRINDSLGHLDEKFKFEDLIEKLHIDLRIAQDELNIVVKEKQVTLALKAKAEQSLFEARAALEQKKMLDASTSNMHKVLRIKAENDKDKLKEEKRKSEYMIADLLKHKEGARAKMRKIKELCDE